MAKVMLTSGKNGGRAVAWIAGVPQGLSKQYVFPPLQWLEVAEVDAAAIRAGTIETGGRTFEVAGDEAAAAVADKPAAATIPAKDAKDKTAKDYAEAGAALGAAVERAAKAFHGDGA